MVFLSSGMYAMSHLYCQVMITLNIIISLMLKSRVMIYEQEDLKNNKVAMRGDQIVIAQAATLTLVATAAMPLFWEVLFDFFGNTPLWVHVRCTNDDKNGRLAYFLFRHHMMVPGYLTA